MVSILHHYGVPLALAHEILVVAKIRKVPTSRALRKMRHLFKVMDSNASPREISADSSPPLANRLRTMVVRGRDREGGTDYASSKVR
jgi:hypothetical protein